MNNFKKYLERVLEPSERPDFYDPEYNKSKTKREEDRAPKQKASVQTVINNFIKAFNTPNYDNPFIKEYQDKYKEIEKNKDKDELLKMIAEISKYIGRKKDSEEMELIKNELINKLFKWVK